MLTTIISYIENVDNIPLKRGKVAIYSRVAEELSRYSTRPNPWTWRYIDGVVSGRLKASRYMQQAIEKLHDEIQGKPPIIAVPACPIPGCTDPYVHLHGKQTFDPAVSRVAPVRKPGKPRPERIAIYKRNPARAARSIVDNLEPAMVKELMQNLMTITYG